MDVEPGGGGGDSSVLDANYPPPPTNRWPQAPLGCVGGGGVLGGVTGRAFCRGSPGGLVGLGGPSGAIWGAHAPKAKRFPSQAPLTSPCPPSNHTITLNLTLPFAASWFNHASHVY